ncbi:MAG: YceH family protein [Arenicella sp.]
MSEHPQDPLLSHEQARVLACLMEKHLATPNNYPLTINSLVLACNQKSNREPVMNLTEGQVGHIVNELSEQSFVSIDYGDRANKMSHRAPGAFKITREEQAVLCMLMLRAPLTINDIKARTERMVTFDSIDAVKATIDSLLDREEPIVVLIPKGSGQREDRYTHLLCGEPDLEAYAKASAPRSSTNNTAYEEKIAALEARIERLENHLGLVHPTNETD